MELDTSSPFKFMASLCVLTITAPIRLVCEVASKIMLTTRDVLLRVLLVSTIMNGILTVAFIVANRFPLSMVNVPLPVAIGSLVLSATLLVSFITVRNYVFSDDLNVHALMKEEYDDEYDEEYDEDAEYNDEDVAVEDTEEIEDPEDIEDPEEIEDPFAVFDEYEQKMPEPDAVENSVYVTESIDLSEDLEED